MATKIASHFVAKKVKHEFGVQDPYFEEVVVTTPDGQKATERRKRETPPGISRHDESVLAKLKKRAYRLELFFSLLGFNVGWTAVIGFIPFVGPAWNLYLAYGTIHLAETIEGGITNWDRSRMVANAAIDFGLGFIPFLGDIMSAIYKGNTRNVLLVEQILRTRGRVNLKTDGHQKRQLVQPGQSIDTPDGRNHLK